MSLREKIEQVQPEIAVKPADNGKTSPDSLRDTTSIMSRIHREILSLVDLRTMENMPPERLRGELKVLAERLLDEGHVAINEIERRRIVESIQNEVMGLGPIEPLLADPSVSDILVNGPGKIYVERRGRLEATDVHFDSAEHL